MHLLQFHTETHQFAGTNTKFSVPDNKINIIPSFAFIGSPSPAIETTSLGGKALHPPRGHSLFVGVSEAVTACRQRAKELGSGGA